MIVLDENILEGQRLLLESSGIHARQIGVGFGHKGLKDEDIVILLRRQRRVTFFTRDAGFYLPGLRHPNYCLVVMSVAQNEVPQSHTCMGYPNHFARPLRLSLELW